MKLTKGKPPIYDKIIEAGLYPPPNTVFTFGDELFIQDLEENAIDPILLAHEEVHVRQQGDNPNEWWDKFITDPQFRFEQELEAYAVEYKKVIEMGFKDKFKKFALRKFANYLCSPMYGLTISVAEAESKIRNKAKSI